MMVPSMKNTQVERLLAYVTGMVNPFGPKIRADQSIRYMEVNGVE
jgi:hypothetical protein